MPELLRLAFAAALGAALVLGVSYFIGRGDSTAQSAVLAEPDQSTGALVALQSAHYELQQEVSVLRSRLEEIEAAEAGPDSETPEVAFATDEPTASAQARGTGRDRTTNTETLVAAGVEITEAEQLLARLDDLAMARLQADFELRNSTAEAREEARAVRSAIPRDRKAIRDEFGDDTYDRFLFATGRPNRVTVNSVLRESSAVLAGVQAGDHLRKLDGNPLFSVGDLTRQVRATATDRNYALELERDGQIIEVWVPGGPIGVRVSGTSEPPG